MIPANQASDCSIKGISGRNIHVLFWFLSMQIDISTIKKQIENILLLDTIILKGCKKWSREEMGRTYVLKALLLAFDKFWFLSFVNISIEKFAIALTESLYFWHPVLSCILWTFWYFFSEIYMSLKNCVIVFFFKFIKTSETS